MWLQGVNDTRRQEASAISETSALRSKVDAMAATLATAKADNDRQAKVCGLFFVCERGFTISRSTRMTRIS
jgi:hypothetical protein